MHLDEAFPFTVPSGSINQPATTPKLSVNDSQLLSIDTPSVADYRRKAERREQRQTAAAMAFVVALAALVFWLLPLPLPPA
jgi:hypothetical protein